MVYIFTIIFISKLVSNHRKNFLSIAWHQKPTVEWSKSQGASSKLVFFLKGQGFQMLHCTLTLGTPIYQPFNFVVLLQLHNYPQECYTYFEFIHCTIVCTYWLNVLQHFIARDMNFRCTMNQNISALIIRVSKVMADQVIIEGTRNQALRASFQNSRCLFSESTKGQLISKCK